MKNYEMFFESLLLFLVKSYEKLRNCFLKVCWLCFCVSVAVFSTIIWKTTKLLFESMLVMFMCFCCCFWFMLLFLVKSYGKLRNCFLEVCWLFFCVSVAVFSKIIWKTTKSLFESLLVMFLCFCCCF